MEVIFVSVLLTDRFIPVGFVNIVLGDTSTLKDDTDIEDNSVLNGATTLVDINSDVLENSAVSRGDIIEDISIVLDGSMLIDSNSIDDDIINLLEDVALIGCVALRGSVMLETIFEKLVALLEIIADVITLLNDTVFIVDCGISVDNVVWILVTVNIIEVVELIMPDDAAVGDTSLADVQAVSFEPIHIPLARLKVHSVTCLLVWPPNINPSLLTLASELHNK